MMGPYDLSAIKRNRPKITTTKSELSTLRAELAAEKERADGNYASIERIKAKWEATCAELATHRSRRAVFEMRIAELEKNLAAAKEHGEQYRKNWLALQNATGEQCHLRALEWIAAATARATAAECHAETLREALEQIREGLHSHCNEHEEECCRICIGEKIESALASSPPRSLAAVKADALLDLERLFLMYHMDVAARLCKAGAERLEKEAEAAGEVAR